MVTREYKDRLFRRLFGAPENRGSLLSLYNALTGSNYTDETALEITTIEDLIFMGMKNDVSCIIDDRLMLMEHQSSYNPNMPLRGLLYFGRLYDQYASANGVNIYGSKLKKIPTPQYFVLYNGTEEMPDRKLLKLSDAFARQVDTPALECTVVMLNVNEGHNEEVMKACTVLQEYAILVSRIRVKLEGGNNLEKSIRETVEECIRDGILAEYLVKNKSEVLGMLFTEYDEEKTLKAIGEEMREEGLEQGRAEGRAEGMDILSAVANWLKAQGRAEEADSLFDADKRERLIDEYMLSGV